MSAPEKTKWAIVNDKNKTFSGSNGKIRWTYIREEVDMWVKGLGEGWRVVDAEAFAKNPRFLEVAS